MDMKGEVLMVFLKGFNGLGNNGVENCERELGVKWRSYMRQEGKRHEPLGFMVEATFSKFWRFFSSYTIIKH